VESIEKELVQIKSLARGVNYAAIAVASIASAFVSWGISIYLFTHPH
jgi:hypothetical protein